MDARDGIGPWLEAKGRQATAYVKLPIHLTATQRLEREKDVVPESDLSHSCENSETDRKDERQPQPSSESTISERDDVVTVHLSEEGEGQESKNARTGDVEREEKEEGKREDNDEEEEVAASNRGLPSSRDTMRVAGRGGKRAALMETNKKTKVLKSSKKQQKNRAEQTNSSRADGDGGESPVRRSSRPKRRSVWLLDTFSRSPSSEEDDLTLRKKMRRVTSAKTDRVDVSDVTPTQTTQAASNSSSEERQSSPVDDENPPSLDTRSHDKRSSGKKRLEGSSVSAPTQSAGSMPPASGVRPSKSAKLSSSATPHGKVSTGNTAASRGSSRLAMAEFMSQRQQLMSRVADPDSQDDLQKRQRSLSESDYGLSDLDLPSVDPKPSVSRKTTASETPRGLRHEPDPSLGLLPPLIDGSHTIVDKPDLERKRVFFRAKQLAFEQLKWHRENEFQQRELQLLRREMETREALAKQELAIKRMRIRADIIQPMISAGASVADIAERLKMLEVDYLLAK